jgi:hypothetical protein
MCRVCSTHEEKRYSYRILVGKTEVKRRLGKPNSLNWILDRIGWYGLDLSGSG